MYNNYNSNKEEPLLNGINKFPLITILMIVFTILFIILYKYLISHPKVFIVLFIIILSICLIGFILKHFHINLKKAFFICIFISISIIIAVLILAQGDYIKIGKNNIISEESKTEEEELEEESNIVKYAKIECFNNNNNNNKNFGSIKGPCFNESTGFGYTYINGSDCVQEEITKNDCSIYEKSLKNKYESLVEEQLSEINKLKELNKLNNEELSKKCKIINEEEKKENNCKLINYNDLDSNCNNVSGGLKSISTKNCPSGYGIITCEKNYSNGKYNIINSTPCEPIYSDFDYLCKQSNTDLNNFQDIGARKYLPCEIDPISKEVKKHEALCDYGYSKTKNLYYNYTPCYKSNDKKSKFDEYCQKKYNVDSTQNYNYNCLINYKRAKCDL